MLHECRIALQRSIATPSHGVQVKEIIMSMKKFKHPHGGYRVWLRTTIAI